MRRPQPLLLRYCPAMSLTPASTDGKMVPCVAS